MHRKIPALLALIVPLLLLLPTGHAAAQSLPASGGETTAATLVDFAFDPVELVVPAGTTVVWTNNGPTIHTVAAADLSWSSPILQAGDSYSQSFDTPGVYPVICTLHPEMVGQVIVQ